MYSKIYNKSNLNDCDILNQTALHRAIRDNDTKLVQYLLEQNIDISIEDIKGNTALTYSCKYKRYDIAKMILRHMDIKSNTVCGITYDGKKVIFSVDKEEQKLLDLMEYLNNQKL